MIPAASFCYLMVKLNYNLDASHGSCLFLSNVISECLLTKIDNVLKWIELLFAHEKISYVRNGLNYNPFH